MTIVQRSLEEYLDDLAGAPIVPMWGWPGEPTVVLVTTSAAEIAFVGGPGARLAPASAPIPALLPAVVAAVLTDASDATDASEVEADPPGGLRPAWCDVVLPAGSPLADDLVSLVSTHPIASTALTQLLRGSESRSMSDGLLLESAVYSTLQAGPEFARWRASRNVRERVAPAGPPVVAERAGDRLSITLDRPHVRNALDASMRDALIDTLTVAIADPSIATVELAGNGPNYCSGGDLDEFGSFVDPANAHLVRTFAAIGPLLAALGDRLVVRVHGACYGSGIELPAFAHRITARTGGRFALPEVRLGLVPGAGGTWSLPRRIGRHRTALLALTGTTITTERALAWGLVDEIDERDERG